MYKTPKIIQVEYRFHVHVQDEFSNVEDISELYLTY